ncbi:histidine kinase [Owenweeksia hongkongensis]|uniref:sensor histidine kinase n=1 Tax=Owenweeksia hongkongensis TaxID=253245 RepID=UPI003A946C98
MKKSLILFLSLLIGISCFSQEMNYREIDLPLKVQPRSVQHLYLDNEGFVWMATEQTLYKHDGNGFRLIEQLKKDGDQKISSLFQDYNRTLWVGWNNGNIDYIRNDSVYGYNPEEGTPSVAIIGWAEDEVGQLWMATKGEGVYVKDKLGRWFNFNKDDGFPSNEIYDITNFERGVAIATDQGLVKCGYDEGKKNVVVFKKDQGLSDQIVKSICARGNKLFLAYYEPFVSVMDSGLNMEGTIKAPDIDAKKIYGSSSITWWLSEDGDLYKRNGNASWEPLKFDFAGRPRIETFTHDNEGHLWVMSSRGLFMIDQWYSHLQTEKTVTTLFADDTHLWYAQGGALHQLDFKTNTSGRLWEGENLILGIFKDYWGNIWCGTFDGGLIRFNPSTGHRKVFNESSGLANNNVLSLSSNKSALWVGTLGGVSQLVFDKNGEVIIVKSYDRNNGVSVQYIYSVHVSDKGEVYIGTDGEGVLHWSGNNFRPLSSGKQDDVVLAVTTDKAGNLWWVNSGGVLRGWSNGDSVNIPPYPEEPGKVSGLQTLEDGSVLVFHEGGIHRWQANTKQWTAYKKSFGLGRLQPELHAYSIGNNDIMYIGSSSGITSLAIGQLPTQIVPETYLEGTLLFNKPTVNTSFSSSDNYLTFKYVGRWYTEPNAVRYRLMLEGFDLDWIESKNTEITYPKLPPSSYTFKVVAGVDGNYPNAEMKQFSFVINQPWYARWYSIVIGSIILIAIVWVIFQVRLNMVQQSQEREKQKVQAQLEMMKSQVNPHFLFNSFNTLMALIEDDREEATNYLSDLSDFFRSILEFREVDLITVRQEVKIIETYLLLQSKRFGEALVTQINIKEEVMDTQIPPLTLQLLAENAFKHNIILKDKPLELKIESNGNSIIIVNKLRPRVNPDSSTGYGLDSIKRKYGFYSKGEVMVEQTVDTFSVHLPLIYKNEMA